MTYSSAWAGVLYIFQLAAMSGLRICFLVLSFTQFTAVILNEAQRSEESLVLLRLPEILPPVGRQNDAAIWVVRMMYF